MCSDKHRLAWQALAAGDFRELGTCFAGGGLHIQTPGPGMLRVSPSARQGAPPLRLLVSVGVHGNETAPIEMLAPVLATLADTPGMLAVDLFVVVGNIAAIANGSRFIDADLNRLFTEERRALNGAAESERADVMIRASSDFFAPGRGPKWHLDLHSAIRPSRFPRFAVVPAAAGDPVQRPLTDWLGRAAIDALVFNTGHAATYSAYTARMLGALSCTVELGQVSALGENRPGQLLRTQTAIAMLLRGQDAPAGKPPRRFRVEQEIIKRSETFRMSVDSAAYNFTAVRPGSIIAVDGEQIYRAGMATEYIVFPNPRVLIGQRAGLTVVADL